MRHSGTSCGSRTPTRGSRPRSRGTPRPRLIHPAGHDPSPGRGTFGGDGGDQRLARRARRRVVELGGFLRRELSIERTDALDSRIRGEGARAVRIVKPAEALIPTEGWRSLAASALIILSVVTVSVRLRAAAVEFGEMAAKWWATVGGRGHSRRSWGPGRFYTRMLAGGCAGRGGPAEWACPPQARRVDRGHRPRTCGVSGRHRGCSSSSARTHRALRRRGPGGGRACRGDRCSLTCARTGRPVIVGNTSSTTWKVGIIATRHARDSPAGPAQSILLRSFISGRLPHAREPFQDRALA